MKTRFLLPILGTCLIFGTALSSFNHNRASAASFASPKTLVLYDAASGTIPSAPLMGFLGFPQDSAVLTYADSATVLDTTLSGSETYAGWVATGAASPGFPILDRVAGFQVNFTIRVENESHARNNRAGFSIILLSQDAKGIELAFWQDQIWAQSDGATGGLFSHGEGIAFATTAGLIEYQVTIIGDTYTLTANHEPLLTGPVRDYSAFDGFPDPYETPNFLFLGDDTTSAQARVRLSLLSVTGTEPVEPTVESTSIGTNTPLPTVTAPPLSSATLIPSPTPTGTAFEVCPSGWILIVILIPVWLSKKIWNS
jgi:hypothetical protein